jgi:hypothetical protein
MCGFETALNLWDNGNPLSQHLEKVASIYIFRTINYENGDIERSGHSLLVMKEKCRGVYEFGDVIVSSIFIPCFGRGPASGA